MSAGGGPRAGAGGIDPALYTDLYELTMLQTYREHGLQARATFELYSRSLPAGRNYLLACGLDSALAYLESLAFGPEALAALEGLGFPVPFLDWLGGLRFTGDVDAMPEGTPAFAGEPLLVVEAPVAEAQLVETYLINQLHFQTLVASKGARIVQAAAGRPVADFGSRRAHGTEAGVLAARALYIAGMASTSSVAAGARYGIPVSGTMAHSYVQARGDDLAAFRDFAETHPETTLLVDTFDTLAGVRAVVELARELGDAFRVRAIRLDSEPLGELAARARRLLDDAGLAGVRIVASGGLDEHEVARLVGSGAPIDAFGVGTRAVTSADAPTLDAVYKLAAYAGKGRLKRSRGKETLPGRKQVFRERSASGVAERDVLARAEERREGEPLLVPVMRGGRRLAAGREGLERARERARAESARLPERLRALEPARPPYAVVVSDELRREAARLGRAVAN